MTANKAKGFTLLELMIVMVVVAILAAVTFPSYTSYTRKAARRAAQAQMMDIANRQQQYLLNNKTYGTKTQIEGTGYSFPSEVSGKYSWDVTLNASGSAPAFTVTFTPTGSQSTDGNLTLTSDGAKAPADKW